MKLLIAFVALATITSCATKKRCFQKFPPTIEVRDSLILKDTTVFVKVEVEVPGDSVTIRDTIPCPDLQYSSIKKSPSGRTIVSVEIKDGKIRVDCKVDSLRHIIDSLKVVIQTKERYRSETKIVQAPPVVKYRAPLWSWAILVLFLALFGMWLYRPISSFIKTVKNGKKEN